MYNGFAHYNDRSDVFDYVSKLYLKSGIVEEFVQKKKFLYNVHSYLSRIDDSFFFFRRHFLPRD